jgi:hypothetical protein
MRSLAILALSLSLASPAMARKRPRPHIAQHKAAPVAQEPVVAAPASIHTARATRPAIAQENDDEVPGARHKK